jgi:hypothetical protein
MAKDRKTSISVRRDDHSNCRRSISIIGIVAVLCFVHFGVSGANAKGKPDFSNASLQGSYALVGTGGAHNAGSVGITVFDGKGKATRSLLLNQAAQGGGREVIPITAAGTYEVNPDGTGSAVLTNVLPDGSAVTFDFDFVITKALPGHPRGSHVAMEVYMMQEQAGIAAELVTFALTRLPD